MKKIAIAISLLLSVMTNFAVGQTKLSFSEYSQMKDNSERIGKYLGVLQNCEVSGTFEEAMTMFGMDVSKLVEADEAYSITLKYLEDTGLSFDDMEKMDDIIKNARADMSDKFRPYTAAQKRDPLSAAGKQAVEICVSVVSNSPNFKNTKGMPSDPIQRMKYLAAISPLG